MRAAQRDVHAAIKALGKGVEALGDALTALVLVVDQAVERLAAQTGEHPIVSPASKSKSAR